VFGHFGLRVLRRFAVQADWSLAAGLLAIPARSGAAHAADSWESRLELSAFMGADLLQIEGDYLAMQPAIRGLRPWNRRSGTRRKRRTRPFSKQWLDGVAATACIPGNLT
jgi:hypothetical protein